MSYANHPNAALIDEVLAHVRVHPQRWAAAWLAGWSPALDAAWAASWDDARSVAGAVDLEAARGAARDADWVAAREAVWTAACALAAYPEEAPVLLRQDPDVVRMAASTGNHAAVLLLPAVIAMASKD